MHQVTYFTPFPVFCSFFSIGALLERPVFIVYPCCLMLPAPWEFQCVGPMTLKQEQDVSKSGWCATRRGACEWRSPVPAALVLGGRGCRFGRFCHICLGRQCTLLLPQLGGVSNECLECRPRGFFMHGVRFWKCWGCTRSDKWGVFYHTPDLSVDSGKVLTYVIHTILIHQPTPIVTVFKWLVLWKCTFWSPGTVQWSSSIYTG